MYKLCRKFTIKWSFYNFTTDLEVSYLDVSVTCLCKMKQTAKTDMEGLNETSIGL